MAHLDRFGTCANVKSSVAAGGVGANFWVDRICLSRQRRVCGGRRGRGEFLGRSDLSKPATAGLWWPAG